MKKTALLVMLGLLLAMPAFADSVDMELPDADEALRAQTREMIQAGIKTDEAIGLSRTMLQLRFTRQQAAQAHRTVMTAVRNGLPVDPMMNKAREGAAKQVPADRVVDAMAQVGERYAAAYAHADRLGLRGQSRDQVGDRMAEGLAAGLNQSDCDRIADRLQDRTRDMDRPQAAALTLESFSMARDLVRMGVSSRQSAEMVGQALQHNYQAAQMQRMRRQFQSQARREDPQGLARQYTQAFQHGRDPAAAEWGGGQGGPGSGQGHGGGGGSGGGSGSGGSGAGSGGHGR